MVDIETAERIGIEAAQLVEDERARQVDEKGYSYQHDDEHDREELAAAAAFYLLPQAMNGDIAFVDTDGSLRLEGLQEVVAAGAFEGMFRDYDDPDGQLELRIKNVARGLALGMAELERLMRMREELDG